MTKIIAILLLLSALPLVGWRTDAQQKALVLTHLTIIDITGGPPKPDMTVVIFWRDGTSGWGIAEPRVMPTLKDYFKKRLRS